MSGKSIKRDIAKKVRCRFIRQESWRLKRLETSWRKPKGIDNKMRLKRKGYPASPSIGCRTPRKIRGLHPSGLSEVLVYRAEDLKGLNPETHALRIAHRVGGRKKAEIKRAAEKAGLFILNPPRRIKVSKGEEKEEVAEEKVEESVEEPTEEEQ